MEETFNASILQNHKVYKYRFDNVEEAISKINTFKKYKELFLKNHPNFKFELSLNTKDSETVLTIETWIFPQLLNN